LPRPVWREAAPARQRKGLGSVAVPDPEGNRVLSDALDVLREAENGACGERSEKVEPESPGLWKAHYDKTLHCLLVGAFCLSSWGSGHELIGLRRSRFFTGSPTEQGRLDAHRGIVAAALGLMGVMCGSEKLRKL